MDTIHPTANRSFYCGSMPRTDNYGGFIATRTITPPWAHRTIGTDFGYTHSTARRNQLAWGSALGPASPIGLHIGMYFPIGGHIDTHIALPIGDTSPLNGHNGHSPWAVLLRGLPGLPPGPALPKLGGPWSTVLGSSIGEVALDTPSPWACPTEAGRALGLPWAYPAEAGLALDTMGLE